MSGERKNTASPGEPMLYRITTRGHLHEQWKDWFEGADITLLENGETVLTCRVIDQSALHGLLKKIRDLGIPLISVIPVSNTPDDDSQR